jgi:hypothetical protein
MWAHPSIAALFRHPDARRDRRVRRGLRAAILSRPEIEPPDRRREATFENLVDELAKLGTASLTVDPASRDPQRRCVCELELRTVGDHRTLRGTGSVHELAALRCLMEGLHELERLARRTTDELDAFLRDAVDR